MSERIYVLDVSNVQKDIDWRKVIQHDPGEAFGRPPGRIAGVVAKASEGSRYADPRTEEHLNGARDVGLALGVYHFARVSGRPLEQADLVLANAEDQGDGPGELPIWLDLEEKGAAARLGGPDAYVEWILRFCERVEDRGFRVGIYSAPVYGAEWRAAQRVAELARWPLWVAQYSRIGKWAPSDTDQPMKLSPWSAWSIWQFSGGGPGLPGNTVPGIDGYVDLNLVNGGLEAWRELLGTTPVEPNEPMGAIIHPDVPLGRAALDDVEGLS